MPVPDVGRTIDLTEETLTLQGSGAWQALSVECILKFEKLSRRVTEEIQLTDSCLKRSVTREISLGVRPPTDDSSSSSYLLLPLTWVPRGHFLHNFAAMSNDGQVLPLAPYRESRALLRVALAARFRQVFPTKKERRASHRQRIERALDELFAHSKLSPRAPERSGDWLRDELHAMAEVYSRVPSEVDSLMVFAQQVRQKYLIAARLMDVPSRYVTVTYAYDSPYKMLTRSWRNFSQPSLRDRWAFALGQRPNVFDFSLALARQGESYHFQLALPAGHYASRVELVSPTKDGDYAAYRPEPPEHYLCSSEGSPYVHAFLSGFRSTGSPLKLSVEASEVQPGALFQPLVTSVGILVVLGFTLALHPALTDKDNGLDSDLPAVILALCVLASSIRLSLTKEDPLRAPLSAKIGVLGNAGLALSATLLFLAQRLGVARLDTNVPLPGDAVFTLDWPWLSLVVLQLGLTAALFVKLRRRMRRYRRKLSGLGTAVRIQEVSWEA
jgi:hypothetical protein